MTSSQAVNPWSYYTRICPLKRRSSCQDDEHVFLNRLLVYFVSFFSHPVAKAEDERGGDTMPWKETRWPNCFEMRLQNMIYDMSLTGKSCCSVAFGGQVSRCAGLSPSESCTPHGCCSHSRSRDRGGRPVMLHTTGEGHDDVCTYMCVQPSCKPVLLSEVLTRRRAEGRSAGYFGG